MELCKLENICKLEKGEQIDTSLLDDNYAYRYINGGIKESGFYNNYNIDEEAVLISEGGASCGYVNYIKEKIWCGCHCYALTECKVPTKYLYYALKANQNKIMALRAGAAMPNIKKSTLKEFDFYLDLGVDVQNRIIKILDKLQNTIELRKQQLQKFDELIKARFVEMFGNPVKNTKDFREYSLSSLGELGRGVSKHRPRNAPELLGGNYPLIQTGEVANAGLYIENYTATYSEIGFKQSKMWEVGTLCITIAANIAKTAILKFDACFPDSIVGFIANEKTNNVFIHFWFSFFQEILDAQAPASAQKNINLQILSDLKVILPPVELQNQFADFVQQIEKQKVSVQKSLEKLDVLQKALMQKYFG